MRFRKGFAFSLIFATPLTLGAPRSARAQSAPTLGQVPPSGAAPSQQQLLADFQNAYANAQTPQQRQQILAAYQALGGGSGGGGTGGLAGALGNVQTGAAPQGPSFGTQLAGMAMSILGQLLEQLIQRAIAGNGNPQQIAQLQNELNGLQGNPTNPTNPTDPGTGTTGTTTPGSSGGSGTPGSNPLNPSIPGSGSGGGVSPGSAGTTPGSLPGYNGSSGLATGSDPSSNPDSLGPGLATGAGTGLGPGYSAGGPSMPLGGLPGGVAEGGGGGGGLGGGGGGAGAGGGGIGGPTGGPGGGGGSGASGGTSDPGYADTVHGRIIVFPKLDPTTTTPESVVLASELTSTDKERLTKIRAKLKRDDMTSISLFKVEAAIAAWKVEKVEKPKAAGGEIGALKGDNKAPGAEGAKAPNAKDPNAKDDGELAAVRNPDGTLDLKRCEVWVVKDWKSELPKRYRLTMTEVQPKDEPVVQPGATVNVKGSVIKAPEVPKELKEDLKGTFTELAAKGLETDKDGSSSSDDGKKSGLPSAKPGKKDDGGDLEQEGNN
jgi:hypothetical protein